MGHCGEEHLNFRKTLETLYLYVKVWQKVGLVGRVWYGVLGCVQEKVASQRQMDTGRVVLDRGGGGGSTATHQRKSREATSCTSGGEEFQFKNRQCLDIPR